MNNKGWLLSNNERGDVVIQKDDESKRFNSDDEATEFVIQSYDKLLEVCKNLIDTLEETRVQLAQNGIKEKSTHWDEYVLNAIEVINKVEGKE